jgi:hypothetical protein
MSRKKIFQVDDPQGRTVIFYDDTWGHIQERHPEIRGYQRIKITVMRPSFILQNSSRSSLYYVDSTQLSLYFNVIVKFDDEFNECTVSTAFLSNKPKSGDIIWTQSTGRSPKSKQ